MNLFRKFGLLAMALVLSVGFVGCSDEEGSSDAEDAKKFKNATATLTCECTGNFYKLVDLSTKVLVNDIENKNFTSEFKNGTLKVVVTDLIPSAHIEIQVLADRNSTAVDQSLQYDRKAVPSVSVKRNFTDGSSEFGGSKNFPTTQVGGLELETIEEYISQYGDETYYFSLDADGGLKQY